MSRKLILTHADPDGTSKIVPACMLPPTARGAISLLLTNLTISFTHNSLALIGLIPGAHSAEIRAQPAAPFAERLG